MKSRRWFLTCGLLAFLALPSGSFGQATSSSISGIVRDTSQAVIAGATVVVTNVDTGLTRQVETDNTTGAVNPTVGRITTITGTARQIQFALKLSF